MSDNSLNAITPIDGRYLHKVKELSQYFSEHALFKYRVFIEREYFIFLCEKTLKIKISKSQKENIKNIYKDFNLKDSASIKKIENKTNHDVKAVEYFIKNNI